jgi:3-hydroxy-9,10-secoandrosta-1,3,5(10)-triene-9,17-dione monooxygenase
MAHDHEVAFDIAIELGKSTCASSAWVLNYFADHDTWYCAGLRASGSTTSVLDNVFVPEHRTVTFSTLRDACSPGSKINTNPIYRTPFIAVHSYALLGPALGSARGGYADFVQWTRSAT